ncbi:hypothetical protein [Pectinatus frisingensis]
MLIIVMPRLLNRQASWKLPTMVNKSIILINIMLLLMSFYQ